MIYGDREDELALCEASPLGDLMHGLIEITNLRLQYDDRWS
jgi:hypothetical protein